MKIICHFSNGSLFWEYVGQSLKILTWKIPQTVNGRWLVLQELLHIYSTRTPFPWNEKLFDIKGSHLTILLARYWGPVTMTEKNQTLQKSDLQNPQCRAHQLEVLNMRTYLNFLVSGSSQVESRRQIKSFLYLGWKALNPFRT